MIQKIRGLKNKQGQSTVEYIILFSAVVAVALTFLAKDGKFRTTMDNTLNTAADGMRDMSDRLKASRPPAPTTP